MPGIYAVLTGDVVSSSRLPTDRRKALGADLWADVQVVERVFRKSIRGDFYIFRGDSFQGTLQPPHVGVEAAIALYAAFQQRHFSAKLSHGRLVSGLRIAIGVGPVEHLADRRSAEATGEAYERSGWVLDHMKRYRRQRIEISTPWPEANAELATECRLLDSILIGWSDVQAQCVLLMLQNLTQAQAAQRMEVSQSAVAQALRRAGWSGVRMFLKRCRTLLGQEYKAHDL